MEQQINIKVEGVRQEDSPQSDKAKVDLSLVLIEPKSELKQQDRILLINGNKFSTTQELMQLIHKYGQGPLELTVARGMSDEKIQQRLLVEIIKKQGQLLGLDCIENALKGQVSICALSGSAAETPLQKGDQILSVNDKRITTIKELTETVAKADMLVIEVNRRTQTTDREQERQVVTVELHKGPDQPLGMGCKMDKNDYIYITSLSGLAKDTKLKVGDRLLSVNGKKVRTIQTLRDALAGVTKLIIKADRLIKKDKSKDEPGKTTDRAEQEDIEEIELVLNCNEGEPIGIFADENLKIVRLQPGSVGGENFRMGDIIKKVNDRPITDVKDFLQMIESSQRPLRIIVNRSMSRESEVKLKQLPQHLEKLIQRHGGFEYIVVEVNFDDNARRYFGLTIANCAHNKVLVSGLRNNGVAANYFKIFDRILAINGIPVTDENVAKSYIFAAGGNFQAIVERPISSTTRMKLKREYLDLKEMRMNTQKDNEMPADVQAIVAKESERRKKNLLPTRSALKQAGTGSEIEKSISWLESHAEIEIQSDVPQGKQLRPV